ncbi:29186_t:CDS:1, partial [Gigaspora margarita]
GKEKPPAGLIFFQKSLKDGGKEKVKKAAILEIIEYDTKNLYFYTHNIPTFFEKDTRLTIQL